MGDRSRRTNPVCERDKSWIKEDDRLELLFKEKSERLFALCYFSFLGIFACLLFRPRFISGMVDRLTSITEIMFSIISHWLDHPLISSGLSIYNNNNRPPPVLTSMKAHGGHLFNELLLKVFFLVLRKGIRAAYKRPIKSPYQSNFLITYWWLVSKTNIAGICKLEKRSLRGWGWQNIPHLRHHNFGTGGDLCSIWAELKSSKSNPSVFSLRYCIFLKGTGSRKQKTTDTMTGYPT